MPVSYREIKARVRDRMRRGDWPPGAALPGEAALAREYGCARATVNRALRELAEEGFLDRRRKSGTHVRRMPERRAQVAIPLIRREIEERGQAYGYRLLSSALVAAPPMLRPEGGAQAGAGRGAHTIRARHVLCLHSADGRPFQREERWIDLATLPQAAMADFERVGPNEWLVQTVPFTEVEIAFTAMPADAGLAADLGCAPGAALFVMERSTWLSGAPVTHARLVHAPGHRMTARY